MFLGFIGSWTAYAALAAGYRVRGTVRSLANTSKVQYLYELHNQVKSNYKVELVEADLTNDAGWKDAVNGCDYILHVASPFHITEPKDENELLVPAIEGTIRVMKAVSEMDKLPKRVIVTSSVAAISGGQSKTEYNDDDWTVTDSKEKPIGAYTKSKTLAERAAWDFVRALPDDKKFELATINPSLVLGPILSPSHGCSSGSIEIIKSILCREFPALVDIHMQYVSVFDVATAHLLAMTHPEANGKRFALTSGSFNFKDISNVLSNELKNYGYSPVSFLAPNWIVRTLAIFGDRAAKNAVPILSKKFNIQSNNARNILGVPLKEDMNLVLQMALAGISSGIIPDKSENKSLSKNYKIPEYDTSLIPRA